MNRSRTSALPSWFAIARIACAALLTVDIAHAQPAPANPPPSLQKIRDTAVVTIANRPDAVPFAYLDDNKLPIGYGIDICRELVRAVERDLKRPLRIAFVEVIAKTRFETVNSGKADMECGTTINDPARRKIVAFSMPYFFSGPRYMVRADSPVRGIQDLAGKRIAIVAGANAVPLLKSRIDGGVLPGTSLVEAKNNDEATAMVARGDVDAYVTIDVLLAALRAKSKDPAALKIVGAFLVLEPVAIALRKDDPEFKRYVDRQLATLMLDGTVARLYEKWFMQPIPPSNLMLDMPMSAALRDQLRWPTDRLGDEITK